MLQSKGYFSFQSEDGEVNLRFNIYTFYRFGEIMNLEYIEALTFLGEGLTIKKFASFLLCAHESYQMSKGLEVTATEYDSICWIDSLGGFQGEEMKRLIKAIGDSVSVKTEKGEEPKKTKIRPTGKK